MEKPQGSCNYVVVMNLTCTVIALSPGQSVSSLRGEKRESVSCQAPFPCKKVTIKVQEEKKL